jgi:hypothetical protein
MRAANVPVSPGPFDSKCHGFSLSSEKHGHCAVPALAWRRIVTRFEAEPPASDHLRADLATILRLIA